jgi:predicted TIM-barrel enzyme
MWHWLGQVKEMGFSGVNNFPTHTIVDGHFRGVLEETGMSVKKEYEMVALARAWTCSPSSMSARPRKPSRWPRPAPTPSSPTSAPPSAAASASPTPSSAGITPSSAPRTSSTPRQQVRNDIFFLCHGGPINTPADAHRVISATDAVGFVGASSLERMGVEESLTNLTRKFKSLEKVGRGLRPQKNTTDTT